MRLTNFFACRQSRMVLPPGCRSCAKSAIAGRPTLPPIGGREHAVSHQQQIRCGTFGGRCRVVYAGRDGAAFSLSRHAICADHFLLLGLTSLLCWWLYYASFQRLELALASTLTFTTSLFVVAMAPFVQGERIGVWRWLTTGTGFIGVILASEITGLNIQPGVLFGLGSAFAAAILIFQNRVLARTEHTATIMFWIGLVASVGTMPMAIASWTGLAAVDALLLITASTLATVGMLLTVEAYRFGEVSALATFPYLRILFAIGVGYFVFAEIATPRELIGVSIIVICGLLANEKRRPEVP